MRFSLTSMALAATLAANPTRAILVDVANAQLFNNFDVLTKQTVDLSVPELDVSIVLGSDLSCFNATVSGLVLKDERLDNTLHTDKVEGSVSFKCAGPRITLRDTQDTSNVVQSTIEIIITASVQTWLDTENEYPITRPPTSAPEPPINGTDGANDTELIEDELFSSDGSIIPCMMDFQRFDVKIGGLGGASSWIGNAPLQENFKNEVTRMVCSSIATELKLAITADASVAGETGPGVGGIDSAGMEYGGMLAGIFSGGAAFGAAALYAVYRKKQNVLPGRSIVESNRPVAVFVANPTFVQEVPVVKKIIPYPGKGECRLCWPDECINMRAVKL